MIGPLTFLDVGLLAVVLLSGLLAMYRGLTREVLSILSWIIAGSTAVYFVWYQKGIAEDLANAIGTKTLIAQISVGAIIFLIVLVAVHLITTRISDSILDSRVGLFDRLLGLVFGLGRGFLLVVIPYMIVFGFLFPQYAETEPWVKNSISKPYLIGTGDSIRSFIERVMPKDFEAPRALPKQQQG